MDAMDNPVVSIERMPQCWHALNEGDDWTGVTSTVERRKRQNRLNSRAFRARARRKATGTNSSDVKQAQHGHVQSKDEVKKPSTVNASGKGNECIAHWSESHQQVVYATRPANYKSSSPLLPYTSSPTILNHVFFPLCPDNLITLIQYNVLRGSIMNCELVSKALPLDGDRPSALTLVTLPKLDENVQKELMPKSLWPTKLQCTVPHPSWIDIVPHPALRDNLILISTGALQSNFDADEFWQDTVGSLFEPKGPDKLTEFCGGIVWSEPWEASGWEFSPGFWRKYKGLFRGYEAEALKWTNFHRECRGENAILLEDEDS
jgi:hypothetical protein